MRLHHAFDREGFVFSAKLLFLSMVIGLTGHIAFLFAAERHQAPVAASGDIPAGQSTVPKTAVVIFSTTTPQRVIGALSIAGAVPETGKFIAADLTNMKLTLYENGDAVGSYPILTIGRPGSPYETPGGFYSVLAKEVDHFNVSEQVHMPWGMQFYGNYFIHGWPFTVDGTPVEPSYSGGCIRLSTDDAEKVFDFADKGTGIFVYDAGPGFVGRSLTLENIPPPRISASSTLVADIDRGDVYLERSAQVVRPIASVTKLMTSLVANETIMFNEKISVLKSELLHATSTAAKSETFFVGDLLYPLLMESNNAMADRLAEHYGTAGFLSWMNSTATSLNMHSTHFSDPSGISAENVSVADDLFRLASYLVKKKNFIFDITRTPNKSLVSESGTAYQFKNFNLFSDSANFIGGKVGKTPEAKETMVSVFLVPINGVARRIAVIVLKSDDYRADTAKLVDWFTRAAQLGSASENLACVGCLTPASYRKIQQ
jgi:lipoprotein-anchoring transpeptidase ErfK/SrfK